jgi:hypothetical protein
LWGQCWSAGTDVDIQVDLGAAKPVLSFRAHLFGYPGWNALKGEVQDRVEIFTSTDGSTFASRGVLQTSLWKKDIAINYMLQDDERATAWNFERTLTTAVSARYVRYRMTPKRILCASELQVVDTTTREPFDIRIALPGAATVVHVPELTGSLLSAAATTLAGVGLSLGTTTTASSTAAEGVVISHTPSAGTPVAPGSQVAVTVSSGPAAGAPEIVLHPASEAQIIGGWTIVADTSAAGGARLQNTDLTAPKLTEALADPANAFDLSFTAVAGIPYRLWIRGKAHGNHYNNDSVFVQFDGTVTAAGDPVWRIGTRSATTVVIEDCSGCGLQGWGWADNGYAIVGPPLYFGSSGPQRIRVQVREDGLGIDQIVISPSHYLDTAPGATRNDTTILPMTGGVTAHAAAADIVLHPASDARIVGGWDVVLDASAAGGARVQNPDLAAPKLTEPLAAPTKTFELSFTAAAGVPYRLWVRGKAEGNNYVNDSVFVQFDGTITAAGEPIWRIDTQSATAVIIEDCSGCGVQGWGWADNGYGVPGPLLYFATSGPQRMRIQVREDGLGIDQVVISPSTYLDVAPGATKNDSVVLARTR